jgi:hypothetical protein
MDQSSIRALSAAKNAPELARRTAASAAMAGWAASLNIVPFKIVQIGSIQLLAILSI